jgi:hypothetical protein
MTVNVIHTYNDEMAELSLDVPCPQCKGAMTANEDLTPQIESSTIVQIPITCQACGFSSSLQLEF